MESELSIADQDLTFDKNETYIPAKKDDQIFVRKGDIYLHNKSGSRKNSGSYYTPDFAVEHLLDGSLQPALDEHLQRMAQLSEVECAEEFFNFRVADIRWVLVIF